jgi:hypothetical protein
VGKLLVLALTLLLAACGGGGDQQPAGAGPAPGADGFGTRTPGVLTVETELPTRRSCSATTWTISRAGSRSTW